jgi:hypothetical protein
VIDPEGVRIAVLRGDGAGVHTTEAAQMVLLRESGMAQPAIAAAMGVSLWHQMKFSTLRHQLHQDSSLPASCRGPVSHTFRIPGASVGQTD